jgi:hypothetical protein
MAQLLTNVIISYQRGQGRPLLGQREATCSKLWYSTLIRQKLRAESKNLAAAYQL